MQILDIPISEVRTGDIIEGFPGSPVKAIEASTDFLTGETIAGRLRIRHSALATVDFDKNEVVRVLRESSAMPSLKKAKQPEPTSGAATLDFNDSEDRYPSGW